MSIINRYVDGNTMLCRCENCGKEYYKKTLGGWKDKHYCSAKCRREAEGAEGGGRGGDEEYESKGESSSSSSGSGFANSFMGNVIAGVVLILLLIIVIGIIFQKKENANDPAVMMEKWGEHLEKRRAAFAEGLSEEGVEARGFKNYTWEEWQAKLKTQAKPVETKPKETKSLAQLYHEYMNKRRDFLSSGMNSAEVDKAGYANLTYDQFKARYTDKDVEAEMKKLNARAEELIKERKNAAQQQAATAVAMPAKPAASARPAAVPAKTSGQNLSKDSKGIRVVVQGKGNTKEAALRSAFRQAVLKTVGTWVDSKSRIEENRNKVSALVDTVTEADIRKYEVMETQQQGDAIVVKVRVSVSKKQIAPKFAKVFPDVFANE